MKKIISIIMVASAVVVMAGCTKEKEVSGPSTFTASIISTKTTIERLSVGAKIKWESDDNISINGKKYKAIPDPTNPSKAEFVLNDDADAVKENGKYVAFYPCSIVEGESPVLPATQYYEEAGSIASVLPMYAVSESNQLTFHNICGILEFVLKGADTVRSIELSDDTKSLSGSFTVNDTFDAMLDSPDAGASVTLDCGEGGIALSTEGVAFYVAVPAGTYSSLQVRVNTTDGHSWTTNGKVDAVVKSNTLYRLPFKVDANPVVKVSDTNLQNYLIANFDKNGDGVIRTDEALEVTEIVATESGISSLEGIKAFTNLEKLVVDKNSIANVDVSGMTKLEELNISFSKVELQSVSLSGCTSLKTFIANDPLDKKSPASLTLDTPALETVNLCLWGTTESIDFSKCTKLKKVDACQLYKVKALDFSNCTSVERLYIPDIFECETLLVKSDKLIYLGAWSSKVLKALDLSLCTSVEEVSLYDSENIESLTIGGSALKILDVNNLHKLTYLDLSAFTNLQSLNAIQLYVCTELKLPTDCNKLTYAWIADLKAAKSLTFKNLPGNARIRIWNCEKLETFNYESAQTVIGWDYGEKPDNVSNVWTIPGNNIKTFNITAPNVKTLFISNLHAMTSLDLSNCPNVEDITMPDAWVMSSFDVSKCTKLRRLLIWNSNAITQLDLSNCAETIGEVNVGTGDGKCDKLEKIILRTGQAITNLIKESSVSVDYK